MCQRFGSSILHTRTFPVTSVLLLTLAGKTHSNKPREHTCTCNIPRSVEDVIGSEDES